MGLRGVYFDGLAVGLFAAELFVPPDGLAALELRLRLADVGGELGFLLGPVRFAVDGCLVRVVALERLEVSAQPLLLEQQLGLAFPEGLVLGRDARGLLLEVGLARRKLALALRDFLVARPTLVLALRERSLAAFELDDACAVPRLELLLGAGELLLTVGKGLALLLELVRDLRAVPSEALQLAH